MPEPILCAEPRLMPTQQERRRTQNRISKRVSRASRNEELVTLQSCILEFQEQNRLLLEYNIRREAELSRVIGQFEELIGMMKATWTNFALPEAKQITLEDIVANFHGEKDVILDCRDIYSRLATLE